MFALGVIENYLLPKLMLEFETIIDNEPFKIMAMITFDVANLAGIHLDNPIRFFEILCFHKMFLFYFR